MNRKRPIRPRGPSTRAVVYVRDLIAQIERMTGVRRRIRAKYYDRADVLAEIAQRISERIGR